jgi:hypothetical protein
MHVFARVVSLVLLALSLSACDCGGLNTEAYIANCLGTLDLGETHELRLDHRCETSDCDRYVRVEPSGLAYLRPPSGHGFEQPAHPTHGQPIGSSVLLTALEPGTVTVTFTVVDGSLYVHSDLCVIRLRGEGTRPDAGGVADAGLPYLDGGIPGCVEMVVPPDAPFTIDESGGPAATLVGPWCGDPAGVLAPGDDLFVGLARGPGDAAVDLEPEDAVARVVSSCIGADFGERHAVSQVRVALAAVGEMCGDDCTPDYVDGCHSGQAVAVYGSEDGDDFFYLGSLSAPDRAFALATLERESALRYVLVCRGGYGWARDNFAIDYIELCGTAE